jgi:Flp pilus assembly protein TadD
VARTRKDAITAAAATLPAVRVWIAAALAVATILAYVPALSAPFVMDDVLGVSTNPTVQSDRWSLQILSPPPDLPVSGRPVVNVTLAVNHALNSLLGVDQRRDPDGRYKAVGYRLLNLVFHLLTGALLFGVLRRAIRERSVPEDWRPLADSIAGMVCALWLLHPVQSEVINYVVQRTEALASLFYVLTLYCSLRAWDAGDASRGRWYAAAVIAAMFGVGSKEIALSAPLAVILYDRAFRFHAWSGIRTAPNGRARFYLILSGACVATFALVSFGGRGQSAGFGVGMAWYDYLYTQCWAILHYLMLVVWPNALSIDYGTKVVTGAKGIPGAIILTAFGAAVVRAWTKLPRLGWFAFLGAWFFILLAPSSSIVPIPAEIAAERRIYLALVSVLVLMVVGAEWARREFVRAISQRQLWIGFGALATVLALTTATRSHTYSTTEMLWRDAVQKVPANPRAWDNLGMALYREGPTHWAEAEVAFKQAMAQDSSCHFGCAQLATVEAAQGRYVEAESLLEHALGNDPSNAPVERTLALVQMKMGAFEKAIPHLRNVASRFPTQQHLLILGVADLSVRRQQDAITVFETASRLYPQSTEIGKLGASLYNVGRTEEALPHLKELAISLAQELQ